MRHALINLDDYTVTPVADGIIPPTFDQNLGRIVSLHVHDSLSDDDLINLSAYPCLCTADQASMFRGIIMDLKPNAIITELHANFGANAMMAAAALPSGATYHMIEPLWIRPSSYRGVGGGFGHIKWIEQIDLNHHISGYTEIIHYVKSKLANVAGMKFWAYDPLLLDFGDLKTDLLICNLPFVKYDQFDAAMRYFDRLKSGGLAIGFNYHLYPEAQRLAHRLSSATGCQLVVTGGFWKITKTK